MKNKINRQLNELLRLTTGTALVASALTAPGADKPAATAVITKPAWLTDISIGVRESYDSNLLGVSGDGPMDTEASWATTVSAKIGFNLKPLLGDQKLIQAFTFGYAPDFVSYSNDSVDPNGSTENYNIHRIATALKGKADAFSFSLDNAFAYVDGDDVSPTYSGLDSTRSAYATGMPRERREQFQDRAKISFQYDWNKWFVRPTAALTYYELLTDQRNVAGYQNYADRYDVNGGADLGYRINPNVALTLGYRYGHQYQEAYDFSRGFSAPNDYQRVLLGIEGKPWKWLTVSIQAGPDFRSYEDKKEASLKDENPLKYYGEANLVAEVSSQDTLTFKYKQWQWVASTGRVPYFDSSFDLTYRHKFSKELSAELGARFMDADYSTGSTTMVRDDTQLTFAASLNYAVNANLALTLGYAYDMARNAEDDVPSTAEDYREFDRHVVGLSAVFKF